MTVAVGASAVPQLRLGAAGHLAIFACTLAAVMLAPAARLPWAAGAALLVSGAVAPRAFRSLMRWRWLVLFLVLAVPPLFIVGEHDSTLWGIPYSSEGLLVSAQVLLRILVVLVAVAAVTASVDITSVAGILERLGLRGLGFSMGVALNLLPALSQSTSNAWRTLRMRGGLRRRKLHGLRLLGMTVIAGALDRAEEIALAAEARAFSPERARRMPINRGRWDWVVLALGVATVVTLVR